MFRNFVNSSKQKIDEINHRYKMEAYQQEIDNWYKYKIKPTHIKCDYADNGDMVWNEIIGLCGSAVMLTSCNCIEG